MMQGSRRPSSRDPARAKATRAPRRQRFAEGRARGLHMSSSRLHHQALFPVVQGDLLPVMYSSVRHGPYLAFRQKLKLTISLLRRFSAVSSTVPTSVAQFSKFLSAGSAVGFQDESEAGESTDKSNDYTKNKSGMKSLRRYEQTNPLQNKSTLSPAVHKPAPVPRGRTQTHLMCCSRLRRINTERSAVQTKQQLCKSCSRVHLLVVSGRRRSREGLHSIGLVCVKVNVLILFSLVSMKVAMRLPPLRRASHHETIDYQWCPMFLSAK